MKFNKMANETVQNRTTAVWMRKKQEAAFFGKQQQDHNASFCNHRVDE
ncbi:MAG: hypothetical protein ND866_22050 [Pyrinomonadaceae bacterium]|nr:hypothetical protein [Pyrinomonadaceae bacterium]